jgi:hypothetical protein
MPLTYLSLIAINLLLTAGAVNLFATLRFQQEDNAA